MKLTRTRWAIAGAAAGLSVALTAGITTALAAGSAGAASPRASRVNGPEGGYMGGGFTGGAGFMGGAGAGGSAGMMGSSIMGTAASGSTVTSAGLTALVRRGERGAAIDAKANTVTYGGRSVTLVALASPHGKPNMTWEIDGLVNPTVVVRPGSRADVVLVNTDWGYMHGFELTTTPPPYPYMAMAGVTDSFLVMPLPPRSAKDTATASYYTRTASFTAVRGVYYYLCPVPGHAAAGMFGTLTVR